MAKKIAVAQMCSIDDPEANYQQIEALVREAKQGGALMVFFPENFHFMGKMTEETMLPQTLEGPAMQRYKQLAAEVGIWLSLGGFQEACPDSEKYYNTHVVINSDGEIASVYQKIHLCEVIVGPNNIVLEGKKIVPGRSITDPIDSPIGKLGLTICFDVRFPELYRQLAVKGAEILVVSAAFLLATGHAHWEVLLRARAIENGCYVIASGQEGKHSEERTSFGHSCVVDPWGTVIAMASTGTRLIYADIDTSLLERVRERIPAIRLRRLDLY